MVLGFKFRLWILECIFLIIMLYCLEEYNRSFEGNFKEGILKLFRVKVFL